jgi:hypothetical protein
MANPAAFDPAPLVTLVRSRTVAKVDSIVSGAQVNLVLGREVPGSANAGPRLPTTSRDTQGNDHAHHGHVAGLTHMWCK